MEEFDRRVFAVALTDSPMTVYGRRVNGKVLKMLKQVCRVLMRRLRADRAVVEENDQLGDGHRGRGHGPWRVRLLPNAIRW